MCEQNFLPVGLHVALILNRLHNERAVRDLICCVEQEDAERGNSPKTSDDDEAKRKDHSEAVNDRLRQFAAFEKRYGRKARGS